MINKKELKAINKQLKLSMSKGFIQLTASPWGAPLLFVKKKDETLRLVIDYSALDFWHVCNTNDLLYIVMHSDMMNQNSRDSILQFLTTKQQDLSP